jgi:hypothetical protein
VGRTPWRTPLDPLSRQRNQEADEASAADQGVRPTSIPKWQIYANSPLVLPVLFSDAHSGRLPPYQMIMHLQLLIPLAALAAASLSFPGLAKAGTCSPFGFPGPTCFFGTDVVYLYYGTLTLESPNGTVLSTTNIETAETSLGTLYNTTGQTVSSPPGLIAQFPTIVPQIQNDPQSTFANLPSWAITNLVNLADANGLGFVQDVSAPFNQPPDPAVVAFNTQLADVGGPYTTVSDTGFLAPLTVAAYCTYINDLIPGSPCTPQTVPSPTGDSYIFTYQVGPVPINGIGYTSDVNFQIFSRDVTEQLVATPEPETLAMLSVAFVIVTLLKRKKVRP